MRTRGRTTLGKFVVSNWGLVVGLIVSLLTVYLVQFLWAKTEEKFKGGAELGKITDNLALAYIAAFITYIQIVYLPDRKNKANIREHLRSLTNTIIGDCERTLSAILTQAGIENGQYDIETVEQTLIEQAFSAVHPNGASPMIIGWSPTGDHPHATWIQYVMYGLDRTDVATEKIFRYTPFLDTEYVRLLNDVIYSPFLSEFRQVGVMMQQMPFTNTDMLNFSNSFYRYYMTTRTLKKYVSNHMNE